MKAALSLGKEFGSDSDSMKESLLDLVAMGTYNAKIMGAQAIRSDTTLTAEDKAAALRQLGLPSRAARNSTARR